VPYHLRTHFWFLSPSCTAGSTGHIDKEEKENLKTGCQNWKNCVRETDFFKQKSAVGYWTSSTEMFPSVCRNRINVVLLDCGVLLYDMKEGTFNKSS